MASINGKTSGGIAPHRTFDVPLGKDASGEDVAVSVRLKSAASINLAEVVEARLPSPTPPRIPLRDKKGPIRDQSGRVVYDVNPDDSAFKRATFRVNRLQTIGLFLELLDDPSWTFDVERPEDDAKSASWFDYYQAVTDELESFGLTPRSFGALAEAVKVVVGAAEEKIEEGVEAFS